MTLAMCGNGLLPHITSLRTAILECPPARKRIFRGGSFSDEGLFCPKPFETHMTIILNQDSAGSAPDRDLVVFDCGWCVIRMPFGLVPGQSALQALDLRTLDLQASAAAPRLCAANDNQLAWPYLAFADDWYASC